MINPTVEDLKTGMFIKDVNGILRLVLGRTLVAVADSGGGCSFHRYNEFLEYMGDPKNNATIMEIWAEPSDNDGLCADLGWWMEDERFLKYSMCLWKRPADYYSVPQPAKRKTIRDLG